MVSMMIPDRSFPNYGVASALFANAEVVHSLGDRQKMTPADVAVSLATAGKFSDASKIPANFNALEQCDRKQLAELDCYPPSYPGLLLQFKKGAYYYMCSRNNSFTNRSQKGRLRVV